MGMHTRITGAAALGYVVASGVETAHADHPVVATIAGAVPLGLFEAFDLGRLEAWRGSSSSPPSR